MIKSKIISIISRLLIVTPIFMFWHISTKAYGLVLDVIPVAAHWSPKTKFERFCNQFTYTFSVDSWIVASMVTLILLLLLLAIIRERMTFKDPTIFLPFIIIIGCGLYLQFCIIKFSGMISCTASDNLFDFIKVVSFSMVQLSLFFSIKLVRICTKQQPPTSE